jgi:hypothetical protein
VQFVSLWPVTSAATAVLQQLEAGTVGLSWNSSMHLQYARARIIVYIGSLCWAKYFLKNQQPLKKSPVFNGTRRFITVLTRDSTGNHLKPDESSRHPHLSSLRSILILSSLLRLGLPRRLFLAEYPTKSLHARFQFHACYVPCPSHPPWLVRSNILAVFSSLLVSYPS